jgi:hypothetical protein
MRDIAHEWRSAEDLYFDRGAERQVVRCRHRLSASAAPESTPALASPAWWAAPSHPSTKLALTKTPSSIFR